MTLLGCGQDRWAELVGMARDRHYVGVVQLKLVRSGGFAGLSMVALLDSADLTADQQGLVAELLTTGSPSASGGTPGGADQFTYQLDIGKGDRTLRHHWAEPDVPEMVRPLLAALLHVAKPAG